jgi:hypothetical protein
MSDYTLIIEVPIIKEEKGFTLFTKLLGAINTVVADINDLPLYMHDQWNREGTFKWKVESEDL